MGRWLSRLGCVSHETSQHVYAALLTIALCSGMKRDLGDGEPVRTGARLCRHADRRDAARTCSTDAEVVRPDVRRDSGSARTTNYYIQREAGRCASRQPTSGASPEQMSMYRRGQRVAEMSNEVRYRAGRCDMSVQWLYRCECARCNVHERIREPRPRSARQSRRRGRGRRGCASRWAR
jgi:hypothetical protein